MPSATDCFIRTIQALSITVCIATHIPIQCKKNTLTLHLRRVEETPAGSKVWKNKERTAHWPLTKTAVIISDMWDTHHCKSAAQRVSEMAPRLNSVIKNLRQRGAHIIHCPHGTMAFYENHQQLSRVRNAPKAVNVSQNIAAAQEKISAPIQMPLIGSHCSCNVYNEKGCAPASIWTKQIDTIEIHEKDAISANFELYYYMEQLGITHVILLGVHANECILKRPFGIIPLIALGYEVALVRDLTDTMYNKKNKPYIDHFIANDIMIWHIEKSWCPTITSAQIIGGEPFRFAADSKPPRHLEDYASFLNILF